MSYHYVLKEFEDFSNDYSKAEQKHNFSVASKKLARYFRCGLNCLDEYSSAKEEAALIKKIQEKFALRERIVLGTGANGILQNLINLFVTDKKDNLVTPYYTFMQAFYAMNIKCAQTRFVKMNKDFSINFDGLLGSADKNTKMIFICNPNNPTNLYENVDNIVEFAKKVKCPVVVSEASIAFSQERSLLDFEKLPENIIVLRSFSKEFGLSGIRLGFAFMSEKYFESYQKNVPTHQVSLVSIKIANKVFGSNSVNKNIKKVVQERNFLTEQLKKLGFEVLPSKSNAIMITTPVKEPFLKKFEDCGVAVVKIKADEENFFVRIAVNSHKENKFLVKVFKEAKDENFIGNQF